MKTPWIPPRTKAKKLRCPKCKGAGLVAVIVGIWKSEDKLCTRCGGKGRL